MHKKAQIKHILFQMEIPDLFDGYDYNYNQLQKVDYADKQGLNYDFSPFRNCYIPSGTRGVYFAPHRPIYIYISGGSGEYAKTYWERPNSSDEYYKCNGGRGGNGVIATIQRDNGSGTGQMICNLFDCCAGGGGGGGASSGQGYQGYGKTGYGLIKCDIEYSDFCIYFAPLKGGNGGIAERPWYWIRGRSGGGGRHGNTDGNDGIAGQFGEINHPFNYVSDVTFGGTSVTAPETIIKIEKDRYQGGTEYAEQYIQNPNTFGGPGGFSEYDEYDDLHGTGGYNGRFDYINRYPGIEVIETGVVDSRDTHGTNGYIEIFEYI